MRRLTVHDVAGRLVATLRSEEQTPGRYSVTWDGREEHGLRVASGIYIVRLTLGSEHRTQKIVVAR